MRVWAAKLYVHSKHSDLATVPLALSSQLDGQGGQPASRNGTAITNPAVAKQNGHIGHLSGGSWWSFKPLS